MQLFCGIDSLSEALSYANAELMFAHMDMAVAAVAAAAWRVELALMFETDLRADDVTQNVCGEMKGAVSPKQFIMAGAHCGLRECGA